MIYAAIPNPQRAQRVFKRPTRISIQVQGAGVVFIGHEQGEVSITAGSAGVSDGIQLTQANSASPSQPYETWWQGELWYRGSVPTNFVMLILSEEC